MRIVIKIGGSLFAHDLKGLYEDIKTLFDDGNEIAIVHGGGPQINEILRKMNLEPQIVISASGMKSRHTDKQTRDVAIMVLGGLINKKLVSSLRNAGVDAIGLTGVDGGIFSAKRKDKIIAIDPETNRRRVIRDEYSGKIIASKVRGEIIDHLLKLKFVPVIGALAIDDKSEILNTDGDRAAAMLCASIKGDLLVSVTDVPGVYKSMDSREIMPRILYSDLDDVIARVEGGMKKKLYAVKEAISSGIPEVVITSGLVEKGLIRAIGKEIGTRIAL
ncbi:MAG: [LysW]-aminoadipate/[LysW]-glutamate kinase [Promethearchaeota archaeon]